jgi:prolyl oligopeptidase
LAVVLCLLAVSAVPASAQTIPSSRNAARLLTACSTDEATDPNLWLEDIEGANALDWVRQQNERTFERLKSKPEYASLYRDALTVLDSKSRIPEINQRGKYVYNLWKDAEHPRGLYRRTTVDSLRSGAPKWETVLDVDALAKQENIPWAFGGMTFLPSDYTHCLLRLSPGGGDAAEVREFDADTLNFVEGGFFLPSAKSRVSWIDENTVYVGTDFGEGSLTESGYPRIVKIWKRGTPLSETKTLYEAERTSVAANARRIRTSKGDIDILSDGLTFWRSLQYQILDGKLERLDLPETADIDGGYEGRLVISLKEEWTRDDVTYPNGSVLVADPAALRGGKGSVQLLVRPTRSEVVQAVRPIAAGHFRDHARRCSRAALPLHSFR